MRCELEWVGARFFKRLDGWVVRACQVPHTSLLGSRVSPVCPNEAYAGEMQLPSRLVYVHMDTYDSCSIRMRMHMYSYIVYVCVCICNVCFRGIVKVGHGLALVG
eukprot:jgi/Botrbrau1/16254/Bobra.0066s0039.1